jgi:hypothetical protein
MGDTFRTQNLKYLSTQLAFNTKLQSDLFYGAHTEKVRNTTRGYRLWDVKNSLKEVHHLHRINRQSDRQNSLTKLCSHDKAQIRIPRRYD